MNIKRLMAAAGSTLASLVVVFGVGTVRASATYMPMNNPRSLHHNGCWATFNYGNLYGGTASRLDIGSGCSHISSVTLSASQNGNWVVAGPCKVNGPTFENPNNGSGCTGYAHPYGYAGAYVKFSSLIGADVLLCSSPTSCMLYRFSPLR